MNRTLAQEWQYARAWESEAPQGGGPGGLHGPLQLGQAARRLRGPAPDVTDPRRKQRHGTQHLAGDELVLIGFDQTSRFSRSLRLVESI